MLPLQITVRNTELSPGAEADIRKRIAQLSRYHERIGSCRVTIEVPQRRRKSDAACYSVRLDITVPGGELVVDRQPREQLRTALQEAFSSARRRLQDYARRQQGAVKTHEPQPIGRVSQYYPLGGYGFIETPDGDEVYFDRNSVLDGGFDRLDVGTEVRFTEEAGQKGPQATTVAPTAQHRHLEPQG
jgi:cold shock CspA family protein/ribosome-associated translation inhibitor RaiA